MHILFLSGWFPNPPNNGSKLRIYNLLKGLAEYHDITLLSFVDAKVANEDIHELSLFCKEIQIIPWKPYEPHSRRAILGTITLTPRSLVDTYSPEMHERIKRIVSTNDFDLVIASEFRTANYVPYLQGMKTLFEDPELGVLLSAFLEAKSPWRKMRNGLTWTKYRFYLSRLLRYFDTCTVVSDQERLLLNKLVPNYQAIDVVPNCINLSDYSDVELRDFHLETLIFTGSFRYLANYDAMTWFLKEVFPLVLAQVPDASLTITGDHDDLPLPTYDHVTLTGFVNDVRPLIASSSVSLAPLRVGGGTRLKILEAMALKTPVIATTKGAEGLDVYPGQHILIADTPKAFAQAIIALMREPELREQLAKNAYQLVQEKYDWASVMPRFLTLVENVASNRKARIEV